MGSSIANSPFRRSSNFQKIADAFLQSGDLTFDRVLSGSLIESIFQKHDGLFSQKGIYNTAVVLWAFLGQVLQDGKMAACQAAVFAIIGYQLIRDREVPTEDTGDYCRARAKLKEAALHELACHVAEETERQADSKWLFKGRHAKLVDGFTFTMPDTPENQAEYPQPDGQEAGCGFPIARCVAIVSLATACVTDLSIAPYTGKETGESALLRQLLGKFCPGDIAVMDRHYCSYMMIAFLLGVGTDVCCSKHYSRKTDFRRGRRLGKFDHIIIWTRPRRPEWMDLETYQQIPKTIELREIRYSVYEPGFRTQKMTVITSLTDPQAYSLEDIAELYGFRWNIELDIRSIKSNLNLDKVRCKSPEMVRRELWITTLAYNLIRSTAAAAASIHQRKPRQISFTATCQMILASWSNLSTFYEDLSSKMLANLEATLLVAISRCTVADRPGRIEPRVVKQRPKRYPYMTDTRENLKKKLIGKK